METLTEKAPSQRPGSLTRRTWPIVVVTVALAAVAIGIWAIVAATQPDELEVATEVVDDWVAASEADDAEAVGALFTENAVIADPGLGTRSGRDAVIQEVTDRGPDTTNRRRTGDLVATEDGTFVFPAQFAFNGATWAGEVEVEMDGDLISRLEWLHWERQNQG